MTIIKDAHRRHSNFDGLMRSLSSIWSSIVKNGNSQKYVFTNNSQYSVLSAQFEVLSTEYCILSTEHSILNTEYSILSSEYRVLGTEYSEPHTETGREGSGSYNG